MRTINVETELPAGADAVWRAMKHPVSFLYVTRGLFGFPALAGRSAPVQESERGTGWITLFHLIPLHRHTIHVVKVDEVARTIRTHEHGGPLRAWNHALRVDPAGDHRCRYSDTVEIDAGALTPLIAFAAVGMYRYRQRRWRRLARRHLAHAATPTAAGGEG